MSPQTEDAHATCHLFGYNPNPQTITWERLEAGRLQRLRLSNKYSRHFNVLRTNKHGSKRAMNSADVPRTFDLSGSSEGAAQAFQETRSPRKSNKPTGKQQSTKTNSLAPFATLGKPTCGFFFSNCTDNRKTNFGIPPSNLVKWRNIGASAH